MAKIFISYRRADSAYATGVIRDQLAAQLPGCEIFLDVDSIPYGVDFRQHLEQSVAACDYLVAVIGKGWLTAAGQDGARRLDDPNDAVRVEVETALRRKIPLIPVFLDGLDVFTAGQLPDSLRELVSRNAVFVRPPPDFNHDVARLIASLRHWIEPTPPHDEPAPQPAAPSGAQPLAEVPADRQRRGKPFAMMALMAALAAGGYWTIATHDGPPAYEFQDSYLFEDANPKPATGEPHSRMLGGGFKLPITYVHWLVRVAHARDLAPVRIPLECRLLDEDGEVVKFSGVAGDLPDPAHPHAGQTEWILSFGGKQPLWKPGKYTLQLDSAEKTMTTSFEIFPAAPAHEK